MATRPSRRTRAWAAREERTTTLARSAQYLARVAGDRLEVKAAAECFAKYKYVSAIERSAKLARGDLLVELLDVHSVRAIDIARRTGERPADLSEMVSVARTFPRDTRPTNATYNHLLLATRAIKRFPALGWTANDALAEILRHELTQHRDVTRYFDGLARKKLALPDARPSDPGGARDAAPDLLDRTHQCRFQDLLSRFADESIHVLAIDPPYVFDRNGDTYSARSASARECDNGDNPAAAIGVVTDLLRDWQPKLAAGGVVLLWQPWQSLLRPIADAIVEYRWAIEGPIVWDKARTQPGRFDSPYSVQGEFLWVLHRPGDRLIDQRQVPLVASNDPAISRVICAPNEYFSGLCEITIERIDASPRNSGDLKIDLIRGRSPERVGIGRPVEWSFVDGPLLLVVPTAFANALMVRVKSSSTGACATLALETPTSDTIDQALLQRFEKAFAAGTSATSQPTLLIGRSNPDWESWRRLLERVQNCCAERESLRDSASGEIKDLTPPLRAAFGCADALSSLPFDALLWISSTSAAGSEQLAPFAMDRNFKPALKLEKGQRVGAAIVVDAITLYFSKEENRWQITVGQDAPRNLHPRGSEALSFSLVQGAGSIAFTSKLR